MWRRKNKGKKRKKKERKRNVARVWRIKKEKKMGNDIAIFSQ